MQPSRRTNLIGAHQRVRLLTHVGRSGRRFLSESKEGVHVVSWWNVSTGIPMSPRKCKHQYVWHEAWVCNRRLWIVKVYSRREGCVGVAGPVHSNTGLCTPVGRHYDFSWHKETKGGFRRSLQIPSDNIHPWENHYYGNGDIWFCWVRRQTGCAFH